MSAIETTVTLPIGMLVNGTLVKDAVITPMTGNVRKIIASPKVRQDPSKVLSTLITQCVLSIGGTTRLKTDVVNSLFIGDRDFLVMEIRKASLGDKVNSKLKCGECGEYNQLTVDLSRDVTIKPLDEKNFTVLSDSITFEIKNKELDIDAVFRLPDGVDQQYITPLIRKNPVEANYALYRRCLISWNGDTSNVIDNDLFDRLPLPVLDYIDEHFMEALPGPDLQIPVECAYCQAEMLVSMESSDFLFRLPKKGNS